MSGSDNVDGSRVVAHFMDGRLLKGCTHDFFPGRPSFHLTSEQETDKGEVYEVRIADLKAVFFVKTLQGDRIYHEKKRFKEVDTSHLKGLRVQLHFKDGEVIRGTTRDYSEGKQGFFMTPVDPRSNNVLVYVVTDALEDIRLAGDVVDDPGLLVPSIWDSATKFID
jgi:hypothetical protein